LVKRLIDIDGIDTSLASQTPRFSSFVTKEKGEKKLFRHPRGFLALYAALSLSDLSRPLLLAGRVSRRAFPGILQCNNLIALSGVIKPYFLFNEHGVPFIRRCFVISFFSRE